MKIISFGKSIFLFLVKSFSFILDTSKNSLLLILSYTFFIIFPSFVFFIFSTSIKIFSISILELFSFCQLAFCTNFRCLICALFFLIFLSWRHCPNRGISCTSRNVTNLSILLSGNHRFNYINLSTRITSRGTR